MEQINAMKKLVSSLIVLTVAVFLYGVAYGEGYTNESMQGTYGIKASMGPKFAAMGIATFEADGSFTASGPANVPAPLGRRQVVQGYFEGTYEVSPDGTGIVSYTGTDAAGETFTQAMVDLVIMEAEEVDGIKVATEIYGVVRTGSLQGCPMTFTVKRLPD